MCKSFELQILILFELVSVEIDDEYISVWSNRVHKERQRDWITRHCCEISSNNYTLSVRTKVWMTHMPCK